MSFYLSFRFVLFFIDFILLFQTYLDITFYCLMYISPLFTTLLQFHYIFWFIYLFAKYFCRLICRFMKPVRSFTRRERLLCRRGVGGFSLIFISAYFACFAYLLYILITLPEGSRWILTHFHFGPLHTLHTLHTDHIDHAYSSLHTLHRDHIDHINYGTPCIYARCAIIDTFDYRIIFFSIILIISSNNQ